MQSGTCELCNAKIGKAKLMEHYQECLKQRKPSNHGYWILEATSGKYWLIMAIAKKVGKYVSAVI
jgi:hypothetical protein